MYFILIKLYIYNIYFGYFVIIIKKKTIVIIIYKIAY